MKPKMARVLGLLIFSVCLCVSAVNAQITAAPRQFFNRVYLPSFVALAGNPGQNPNPLACISNPKTLTEQEILNCVYDPTNKALYLHLVDPVIPTVTVATLPTSPPAGTLRWVSNGASTTDCTAGGGSTRVLCAYSGAAWSAIGGGGGGGSGTVTSVGLAGTANQITVTGTSPITTSGSWTLSFPSAGVTLPGTTSGTFSGNLTGNAATATVSSSQISNTTFYVGLNRGSNALPAFNSNYTVSHWTEGSGSMAVAYTGANSFTPTTAVNCVIGQTYQFDLVVSSWTSGTFTLTACGVTSPTVSPSAAGDFRFYVTATATTSPSVSAAASGAQAMTFSSFTMKRAAYDSTSGANVNIVIDTNSGLTVPLTVYQPPALAGWTYQEYVIAAYAVTVKTANGTDTWEWGASTYTNTLTFAATRQTFLTLVCFATGYWDIAGINGSVTPA